MGHQRVIGGWLVGFGRDTNASNGAEAILDKVMDYLHAGAACVWVVYANRRVVAVHSTPEAATFVSAADLLDGGDVLPGFHVPAIFDGG